MLLEQMIVLFLLMGVGFLCYKKSLITDEVSKKLSSVVVNVANPALVPGRGASHNSRNHERDVSGASFAGSGSAQGTSG